MRLELYDEITILYHSEQKDILLVQHMIKNLFFVKKIIHSRNDLLLYQALSKHPHQNLANIMEYAYIHDKTIVIEEFVNGCTLEYRLSQRIVELYEVMDIMFQMFHVTQHIHQLPIPIIHRDIKPENIMVSNRKLYLIDFEIAKCLTSVYDTSSTGSVGYASPEQYNGYSDERADIYALGKLLETLCEHTLEYNRDKSFFQFIIQKSTSIALEERYPDVEAMRLAFCKECKKLKIFKKYANSIPNKR